MEEKKEKLEGLLIALDNLKETMTRAIGELSSRVEDAIKEADFQPELGGLVPFDITKAKQGAKVVTASGEDVRILCYDRRSAFEIVALIQHTDDEEEVILCTEYGKLHVGHHTDKDLRILE